MDYNPLLLLGILPALLGIGAMAESMLVFRKAENGLHFFITCLIFLAAVWSLMGLFSIFVLGGWPSYLPHIVIGILVVVAQVQLCLYLLPKKYTGWIYKESGENQTSMTASRLWLLPKTKSALLFYMTVFGFFSLLALPAVLNRGNLTRTIFFPTLDNITIEIPDDYTGRVDLYPDPSLKGQTHRYYVVDPNGKTPIPNMGIFNDWHTLVIKTKSGKVVEEFDERLPTELMRQKKYYRTIFQDKTTIRFLIESPEYIDNFLRDRFPG